MIARRSAHFLSWLVWLLAMGATSCVVNPVPTPAAGGTTSLAADATSGGATDNGSQDDATASAKDTAYVPDATAVESFVPATATQAGVSGIFGDHVAIYEPGVPSSGKLVVLLPNRDLQPKDYTQILRIAAQRGHRVLGLAYPSTNAAQVCKIDGNCYEYLHHETLDGQDHSDKVVVGYNNCIEQRLAFALQWLVNYRPGQGWGSYVSGNTPLWQSIIIVGDGEGAGQAGFIGKVRSVARVVLLQGPLDSTPQGPAAWIASSAQTPASAWYGLADNTSSDFSTISANWLAIGLGSSQSPVSTLGAFGSAHGLVTDGPLTPASVDDPDLKPAWWYLFTP